MTPARQLLSEGALRAPDHTFAGLRQCPSVHWPSILECYHSISLFSLCVLNLFIKPCDLSQFDL